MKSYSETLAENELERLRKENDVLRKALEAQLNHQRELRADRDRLDLLIENCRGFIVEDWTTGNRDVYEIPATRESIDKFREQCEE